MAMSIWHCLSYLVRRIQPSVGGPIPLAEGPELVRSRENELSAGRRVEVRSFLPALQCGYDVKFLPVPFLKAGL